MKPLDRSEMIRKSVSVFIDGLLGFLPFIGIIPAVCALVRGIRIRRAYREPNPADHYRKWGMALAAVSVLVNLCAVLVAITNVLSTVDRGFYAD